MSAEGAARTSAELRFERAATIEQVEVRLLTSLHAPLPDTHRSRLARRLANAEQNRRIIARLIAERERLVRIEATPPRVECQGEALDASTMLLPAEKNATARASRDGDPYAHRTARMRETRRDRGLARSLASGAPEIARADR